jgi:hypothetical protein
VISPNSGGMQFMATVAKKILRKRRLITNQRKEYFSFSIKFFLKINFFNQVLTFIVPQNVGDIRLRDPITGKYLCQGKKSNLTVI